MGAGPGWDRARREVQRDLGRHTTAPGARSPAERGAEAGIRPPESMRTFLPTLARVVPEWSTVSGADADPSTLVLGEGVLRLLHALARPSAPVVFIVEDLQWADAESLAVVEYLADNISESAVAIVATLRTGVEAAGTSLAHTLIARRTADAVVLHALDADDVMTMARDIVGEDLPLDAAATLQARSEGVPFLIEELLAAAEPTGWSAIDDAMPGSVTAAGCAAPRGPSPRGGPPAAARRDARARLRLDRRRPRCRRGRERRRGAAPKLRARAARGRRRLRLPLSSRPDPRCGAARRRARRVEDRRRGGAGRVSRGSIPSSRASDVMPRRCWRAVRGNPDVPRASCSWRQHARRRPRSAGLSGSSASSGGRGRVRRPPLRDRRVSSCASRRFPARSTGRPRSERVLLDSASSPDRASRRPPGDRGELRSPPASGGWPRITPARSRRSFSKTRRRQARATAISALAAMGRDDGAAALPIAELALSQGRATLQPVVQCEALEVIGRAQRVHDTQAAEAAFEEAHRVATDAGLALWRVRALQELGTIDLFESLATERLTEARRAADEVGALALAAVVDLQLAGDARRAGRSRPRAGRRPPVRGRLPKVGPFDVADEPDPPGDGLRVARRRGCDERGGRGPWLATGEDSMNVDIGLWGNAYPIWHLAKGDLSAAAHAFDRAIDALRQRPGGAYPWPGLWALARTVADSTRGGGAPRRSVTARRHPGQPHDGARRGRGRSRPRGRTGPRSGAVRRGGCVAGAVWRAASGRRSSVCWLPPPHARRAGGSPRRGCESRSPSSTAMDFTTSRRCPREALRGMNAPVPRRSGTSLVPTELAALGITSREVDVLSLIVEASRTRKRPSGSSSRSERSTSTSSGCYMKAGTNRAGLVELAAPGWLTYVVPAA